VGGRLNGRVTIVTGGSSGIGRASALRFAEEGASVVIADVRDDPREVDIGEWDSHFALNVRGTFLCAQAALRHMAKERYGKVIMIASNFGLVGVPELTAYCAGKAAVIGMARSLAGEFGPLGVNVNALCPGATKTAINLHFRSDPERQADWRRMTPLRMDKDEYIAEPRDLANAALYLASDESRFMTGATLVVDGGWIAL
jgi:NAD(P)-dependent dehydrogenase (short-subunit alcohol dehydrogenase family)